MSVSLSSEQLSVIVTRLRAAGCVFAEDEARLLLAAARTPDDLAVMVGRRVAGLPLEHVVGWAEFGGLRIAVDPGVFVPRRRTEFLASRAVTFARHAAASAITAPVGTAQVGTGHAGVIPAQPRVVVVDLCCGAGGLGAVVAAAVAGVELHAADIDPAAVRCARRNLAAVGGEVHLGDLCEALPARLRGRVDVLVANVPYVPTDEIGLLPPEARLHEAQVALDGGADGLDVLRRVAAEAPRWLAPGGHLLSETSDRQAPLAVEAFVRNGLIARVANSDEVSATVVTGTVPAARTVGC